MKKKSAIFFDRDGVLNIDKGYVFRISDFEWIAGAKEALKLAREKNYLSIIVTNQAGIARGYYSIGEMHQLHNWIKNDVAEYGAEINDIYYCPYHSEGDQLDYIHADHPDRKPNPGMILRAIKDHNIDVNNSLLIGDKDTDIEAARRAGLKSILFDGNNLHKTLAAWFDHQTL
jgi:D-glycero-D-manno-heptose 1,7-bisphosphate phosphatase